MSQSSTNTRSKPEFDPSIRENSNWLMWLVRLRWLAIVAQLITLSMVSRLLTSPVLVVPLIIVIMILVGGNLWALQILNRDDEVSPLNVLMQLCLDVIALTAFFVLAGGPYNPFTVLYLIHVAMGSVMLRANLATALVALVIGCYGLIHAVYLPLDFAHHTFTETTLLRLGDVVSFLVTTLSVAIFVTGLSTTLRRREQQLLVARDRTSQTDRLRAVGTLAAGAAHELNTPLSTLGLRVRRVARRHQDPDTVGDIEAIQGQLERCRTIVEQLLVGAGDPSASDIAAYPVGDLVDHTLAWWSKGSDIGVTLDDNAGDAVIEVPRVAFIQALVNLLENAREAQHEVDNEEPIEVLLTVDNGMVQICVADQGSGLPDTPERVGDPFFTTKATGTGLGVYVARAVATGSGGGLRYESPLGAGTRAWWWFPEATPHVAGGRL